MLEEPFVSHLLYFMLDVQTTLNKGNESLVVDLLINTN